MEGGGEVCLSICQFDARACFERVLALVREGMSRREAIELVARETGLKKRTIEARFYKFYDVHSHGHGNSLLTAEQQQVLVLLAITFSASNLPWNNALLKRSVKILFDVEVNGKWCERWGKAQKEKLSKRKAKLLDKYRASAVVVESVEAFVCAVEERRETLPMAAHNVLNYDETRVCVQQGGEIVFEHSQKNRPAASGTRSTCLGSLLTFISAAGVVVCSFWILKGKASKNGPDDELVVKMSSNDAKYNLRGNWNRYYGVTDTGYINGNMFDACIRAFVAEWKLRHPGLKAWVLGDQLACHSQLDITLFALANGVELWLLPSNCSHFLQPLDHLPFARFKQHLRTHAHTTTIANFCAGIDAREGFFALALAAEQEVFTPRVIQRSFEATGIFPWDPKKVINLAKTNCKGAITVEDQLTVTVVDAAGAIVRDLVDHGHRAKQGVTTNTVHMKKNTLFSPSDRVAAAKAEEDLKLATAQSMEEAKQQKKKEKEEKSAAQKLERQAKREHLCCRADECTKHFRGGSTWAKCDQCSHMFCPKHKSLLRSHECNNTQEK